MSETAPTTRRTWFDSIPWWLWAAIAALQPFLIAGRLDDLSTTSQSERTKAAMIIAGFVVWGLLTAAYAVRAWRRIRKE